MEWIEEYVEVTIEGDWEPGIEIVRRVLRESGAPEGTRATRWHPAGGEVDLTG